MLSFTISATLWGGRAKKPCDPMEKLASRPAGLKKFSGEDKDFPVATYATAKWRKENKAKIATLLVLDTETTGLDVKQNSVIEIGLRLVEVNRETGELLSVGESYNGLQDPGAPLTAEITRLTGITDARLSGQSIDWKKVKAMMAQADVVLAHNAEFDRAFVEAKVGAARDKTWACSFRQMDWHGKGFPTSKLPELSHAHGFYVDAHRALEDVNALIYLMTKPDGATKTPYFAQLMQASDSPTVRMEATGSPFSSKDSLKSRGYSWNAEAKTWWKYVTPDNQKAETQWLTDNVYGGTFKGKATPVKAADRFRKF